jgi:hypothetical protein
MSNKVDPEPDLKSKEISLSIYIPKSDAIATYAGEDASVAENHIDTIYIDLKQNGAVIHSEKIFGNRLKVEPGSRDSILHVGFEVDNITTGALTVEAYAGRKYIQPITTEIPLPDISQPATLFMMSGSAELSYKDTAYQGTIHLIRNVSKLRIRISKHPVCLPSDLIIDYDNIKIQLLKVPDRTTLFGPGDATAQPGFSYIDYPERTASNLRKASHFSSTDGGQIDSLYLNENYLTNEGDYNQSNTTKVKITIPTLSMIKGGKTDSYEYAIFTNNSYRILRNSIYTLDIQVRGQSLEPVITVNIHPWKEAEVSGSVLGAYFTTNSSVIEFDDTGNSAINFCTDAQAVYFNWSDVKSDINKLLTPSGIEILSDEKGQILLDKQHCGQFSFKLDLTKKEARNISGKICLTAGNIVRCLTVLPKRTYDAHYILGDSLMGSNDLYTAAAVESGSAWLHLSKERPYKPAGMLSAYTEGVARSLFLHLDENLTGAARTGIIGMTRSDGVEQKLKITQLPALYVGQFGTASTAQHNIRYDMGLYTEQIPDDMLVPYKINNDNTPLTGSFYSGLRFIQEALDASGYIDNYRSVPYPAINYCAYKNRDKNGNGVLEANEIEWYLPAQAQLMGMWISFYGYGQVPTSTFPLNVYWSASNNWLYANEAQYVNFTYGNVGHYLRSQAYGARCVRNYGAADNTMITITTEDPSIDPYPIIDFSKGLSEGSYTNESKSFTMVNEIHYFSKTVYKQLRIAKKDMQNLNEGILTIDWTFAGAGATCGAFYNEEIADKGYWRLPTQREMQAIWIFQEELKAKCSTFDYLSDSYYWTITVSSSYPDNAWTVYGIKNISGGGNTPNQPKLEKLRARCVMEIN